MYLIQQKCDLKTKNKITNYASFGKNSTHDMPAF